MLAVACGADWTQFRGPNSNSATRGQAPPLDWSDAENENIAWKVELPGRGPASPIVVGDRVIVTCSSGVKQDRLHVLCFEADSGERLWERQFWATGRTLSHPSSANAAPTPASDGELIFAFFSSNDLACLDLDGNLRWFRGLAHDFPQAGNDVGMSSSPVVIGDTLVAQVENQGDSFATGIDKNTGQTRWRVPRPRKSCWTSPVVMRGQGGEDLVLLQSPTKLTAHDPETGEEVWAYETECDSISSPAAVDGSVYVASKGITALEPTGSRQPEVEWNAQNLQPGAASVVVADDQLFIINRAGVLSCAGTKDGKVQWRVRLDGEFWGTPALVGDRLYCVSQKGSAQVVDVGEGDQSGKIIGRGQFDGAIQASPAAVDGALYVRSDGHLWKVATP
ncbi:MAG: pyrrolo-quinoline quinone [Planctomycetota bacterium]|nr:MAG: pyrrolo-quinoline quinone [Planctomycetota bacterium]